ncbi:MAG: hypothetical protein NTX82_00105 [Candidatus Parcubacteria bacterium]|nr:hypothetical protein [Candidatus Parcubacteria bacterium]
MEMSSFETDFGKKPGREPIKVEGMSDEQVINQLLENVPPLKKEGLRELIDANLAKGDRELPVLLMRMQTLVMQRKTLYQQYEQAPANKKLEFSQKLLKKWDEIEKVAGAMDKKIATTLLAGIMETLKIRQ